MAEMSRAFKETGGQIYQDKDKLAEKAKQLPAAE
jgi:hypothetical protein